MSKHSTYFPVLLDQSNGQYTDKHVDRIGLLAGCLRKNMEKIFHENIGQTYMRRTNQTMPKEAQLAAQVRKFIEEYEGDELLSIKPKRKLRGNERFFYSLNINNISKLKEKLIELSTKLDTVYDKLKLKIITQ